MQTKRDLAKFDKFTLSSKRQSRQTINSRLHIRQVSDNQIITRRPTDIRLHILTMSTAVYAPVTTAL